VPGGNFWSPQANQTAEAFEAEVPPPPPYCCPYPCPYCTVSPLLLSSLTPRSSVPPTSRETRSVQAAPSVRGVRELLSASLKRVRELLSASLKRVRELLSASLKRSDVRRGDQGSVERPLLFSYRADAASLNRLLLFSYREDSETSERPLPLAGPAPLRRGRQRGVPRTMGRRRAVRRARRRGLGAQRLSGARGVPHRGGGGGPPPPPLVLSGHAASLTPY